MSPDDDALEQLRQQLQADTLKKQISAAHEIMAFGAQGLALLWDTLIARRDQPPTILDGKLIQLLFATQQPEGQQRIAETWPQGRIPTPSAQNLDYQELQQLLVAQSFQEADRLTLHKLCELAGETAVRRNWLYFTEVEQFPSIDLHTLDTLWSLYSEGKFGFSRQRQIWLGQGQNWDKLWPRIAWKQGNLWTRYPTEFIWDLSAPDGHLPLSNQLRGVRVMAALLTHPAWEMSQS